MGKNVIYIVHRKKIHRNKCYIYREKCEICVECIHKRGINVRGVVYDICEVRVPYVCRDIGVCGYTEM